MIKKIICIFVAAIWAASMLFISMGSADPWIILDWSGRWYQPYPQYDCSWQWDQYRYWNDMRNLGYLINGH